MARKTEFLAHAGPVRNWQLDRAGRPEWIAKIPDAMRGPWACIVPPLPLAQADHLFWPSLVPNIERWERPLLKRVLDAGPAAMPCFRQEHVREIMGEPDVPPKRGRPKLDVSEYERARWIAWIVDVRREGMSGAARRLEPDLDNRSDLAIPRHFLRKAERFRDRGRKILQREGVLPWFAFSEGQPSPRWDMTLLFQLALQTWYGIYVAAFREQIRYQEQLEALLHEYGAKSAESIRKSRAQVQSLPQRQREWLQKR